MRNLTVALLLLSACRDVPKESGLEETNTPKDTQVENTDADGDGFGAHEDCNDSDSSIHPDAIERCDGVDNDCDGLLDDDDPQVIETNTWYLDFDQDGFGGDMLTMMACDQPDGFVDNHQDCQDADEDVHPDAVEICDGMDNDCDDVTDGPDSTDALTWYSDTDGDGYGTIAATVTACDPPAGFALHDGDCDDEDPAFHPGALESDCADPTDYNCDGSVGFTDADNDGFAACEDCDDSDGNANDDAAEICDGVDNDCDGLIDSDDPDTTGTTTWYADADGDGHGGQQFELEACEAAPGYVASNDDCDDLDENSYPGGAEVCDDADNDCDNDVDEGVGNTWYADSDSDGYGNGSVSAVSCDAPSGYVSNALDCDDFSSTTNPGSYEICDGADNDCDGTSDEDAINATTWYVDGDADGYGSSVSSTQACAQPSGHAGNNTDCNDSETAINPGATETCDSIDNDCDGSTDEDAINATTWYADSDADGFGDSAASVAACTVPSDYVADSTDCDDQNGASTNTTSDADCDGTVTAEDCDDTSATSTTLATDGDCDGTLTADDCDDASATSTTVATDADCDGYLSAADCNDADASIHPGATEICDGVDNDCDGAGDEAILGSEATCPAVSCLEVQQANTSATTGKYWIAPLGTAFEAYCDMDSEGGGWTLVAWINSGDRLHANNAATVGDVTAMSAGSKLSDALTTALNTGGYWRYECGNAKRSNVKTDSGTFNSAYNNSENWWLDNDKNGTYECAANRSGYVFADYPGCAAGHTDYGATDGTGCYVDGEGWSRPGSLWAR